VARDVTRRPVTIRDVADRAGVAISTVSHAFSGRRTISPSTRERVLRAAEELDYDPNPSARSLRTGRCGIVGLVLRPRYAVVGTPDRYETFNRLVGAVATHMLRHRTGLLHVPDPRDPTMASVPMDGCIVAHPYRDDSVLAELVRRGVPVVTIDEDTAHPDFTWTVRLDYLGAVTELLEHLREQGASDVMLITGTEDNAWNRRARESYLAWCAHHDRRPRSDRLSEGRDLASATTVLEAALDGAGRPDALVVSSSEFAALAADIAAERGLAVPDQLMIVALTDTEHTRTATPPITSLDLNHESLAEHAVELMLSRLAGAETPAEALVVNPVAHRRASTDRAGRTPGR
jgi:DNA-binding LacI/PurR family transcriptional regulator